MAQGALGSGTRFRALTRTLSKRKGVENPKALAAYIGRKKYGAAKFAGLAAKGRARGQCRYLAGVFFRPARTTNDRLDAIEHDLDLLTTIALEILKRVAGERALEAKLAEQKDRLEKTGARLRAASQEK